MNDMKCVVCTFIKKVLDDGIRTGGGIVVFIAFVLGLSWLIAQIPYIEFIVLGTLILCIVGTIISSLWVWLRDRWREAKDECGES